METTTSGGSSSSSAAAVAPLKKKEEEDAHQIRHIIVATVTGSSSKDCCGSSSDIERGILRTSEAHKDGCSSQDDHLADHYEQYSYHSAALESTEFNAALVCNIIHRQFGLPVPASASLRPVNRISVISVSSSSGIHYLLMTPGGEQWQSQLQQQCYTVVDIGCGNGMLRRLWLKQQHCRSLFCV